MKTTREDWLDKGLEILGSSGAKGLTIEKLCLELGLTKGSFYHHFSNVGDYTDQLLEHWAGQYKNTTDDLPRDPEELLNLLDMLMKEVFKSITLPEASIRSMASHSSRAKRLVEEIDQHRFDFLLTVFQSLVADQDQARLMAETLLAITIGSMATYPRMDPDRVYQLYLEFRARYLGSGAAPGSANLE